MNLADWSGDAQVKEDENEQKHALTSKSIQYDVAKVYVKVVLAAFKMYIAFLPDPELAFSCVVVCGGTALLILGWHFDQFYEADMAVYLTHGGGSGAGRRGKLWKARSRLYCRLR